MAIKFYYLRLINSTRLRQSIWTKDLQHIILYCSPVQYSHMVMERSSIGNVRTSKTRQICYLCDNRLLGRWQVCAHRPTRWFEHCQRDHNCNNSITRIYYTLGAINVDFWTSNLITVVPLTWMLEELRLFPVYFFKRVVKKKKRSENFCHDWKSFMIQKYAIDDLKMLKNIYLG